MGFGLTEVMSLSMSAADTTPSLNRKTASFMYGINRRLEMKPGKSFAKQTCLPIASQTSFAARTEFADVARPEINSTTFMTGTGLKKCMPTTLSGRFVAEAIFVMLMDEVLLARTTSGFVILSKARNSSCLSGSSSVAASITRSTFTKSSRLLQACRRFNAAFFSDSLILFFCTDFVSQSSANSLALLMFVFFVSNILTLSFAFCAATMQIPVPSCPVPTTPNVLILLLGTAFVVIHLRKSHCVRLNSTIGTAPRSFTPLYDPAAVSNPYRAPTSHCASCSRLCRHLWLSCLQHPLTVPSV
mmetsp:Transcript_829/g.2682  ORF Transcript_829/g.2682 Transcript_829/m.2682 type:complete len:301 (+) Transcript_829:604-1506(+)